MPIRKTLELTLTEREAAALCLVISQVEDIDDETWFTLLPTLQELHKLLYGAQPAVAA